MMVNVNYVIIVKGGLIMRNHEKQRLHATIEGIKYMQKMKFDKYVILNNLDSMIERYVLMRQMTLLNVYLISVKRYY